MKKLSFFKKVLFTYIIPPLGFFLMFLISITLKIEYINRESEYKVTEGGKNCIYTFWHGRLFCFPYIYRGNTDKSILVSPSIDGEIISRILKLFGFSTIRGSSYKAGREAYWQLSKVLKQGNSTVLIGDGSRGPKYKIQKGIVHLAKSSGKPIIPMVYAAKRKKVLNSWDNFIIPYPFSSVVVWYGEPVYVSESDSLLDKMREAEESLNQIMHKADNRVCC